MKTVVLDKGYVRLVDSMGSDLSIVRAARVSYDADWRTGDDSGKDEKLIKYLMKNKHTSPFESVVLTFEIKCPFFIARQWHRHRTWAYNEISARYCELDEGYYVPDPDLIGVQSKDNKQMREVGQESAISLAFSQYIAESCEKAFTMYKVLIKQGCPRELARSVLPMAAYTRFFGTVNLHNLLHFINLRIHEHAQYEIREYAQALLDLTETVAPITVKYFKETR